MSTENLKVVITGDASGLSKTTAQASASMAQVSRSTSEWDANARKLAQDMNYTTRSSAQVGKSWASLGKQGKVVAQRLKDIQAARAAAQGGATKMVATLNRSAAGSIRTQYALSDLSRGLEGFNTSTTAGINGIARFAHEFTYLQQQSGSTRGAFKLLGESIMGPIGIIFAVGALANIMSSLIEKYGSFDAAVTALFGHVTNQQKAQNDLNKALSDGSKEIAKTINGMLQVQSSVTLASEGYISSKDAISQFNKTLGDSLGKVSSLKEAQDKLNASSQAYVQAMAYKTVATQIFSQATDEVVKNIQTQAKANADVATFWEKTVNFAQLLLTGKNTGSGNIFSNFISQLHALNDASGASEKRLSQLTTQNDFEKKTAQAQKYLDVAAKIAKQFKVNIFGGGGSDNSQTATSVLDSMNAKLAALAIKEKEFGLSVEQVDASKLKIYNDTLNQLATVTGPAAAKAMAQVNKAFDNVNQSVSKNPNGFLPTLTGGRAGVNTPAGITGNPGVPTFINPNGAPSLNTNNAKVAKAQAQAYSQAMRPLIQQGRQLEGIFNNVFSTIANGGNAFQALAQAIEGLIVKLAAAAAAAAILTVLTDGSFAAASSVAGSFKSIFSGLSGISFASGGYIPSARLAVVGDAPGGEWVLNQRQISAILNGVGGGRNVQVTGEFRIQGNDLVAAVNSTNDRNRRVNG